MPDTPTKEEIAKSHRWHAVECNNRAWRLADQPARTASEEAEMLDAAHAAAFHWGQVGTDVNVARATTLLAHVHALLGRGETAWRYAQDGAAFVLGRESEPWERAFAHAMLAHAAYAAGRSKLHEAHHAEALEIAETIADRDEREIFDKSFGVIPKP